MYQRQPVGDGKCGGGGGSSPSGPQQAVESLGAAFNDTRWKTPENFREIYAGGERERVVVDRGSTPGVTRVHRHPPRAASTHSQPLRLRTDA
jgi:hypothetical protein